MLDSRGGFCFRWLAGKNANRTAKPDLEAGHLASDGDATVFATIVTAVLAMVLSVSPCRPEWRLQTVSPWVFDLG